MSNIDPDDLLSEVSADSPCGDDLEYDAAFLELQTAAEGKPEQQIGDTVVEAEEPNWAEVGQQAVELFARTKDLRVALYLNRALLKTEGFVGLRDGLKVTQGLIDRYWEAVHPRLDPDDDNDPTMRINILVGNCDPRTMLDDVRRAPLVSSRSLGRFGLRDIALARGDISLPDGSDEPVPEQATIDGAFMDVDAEELLATAEALREGAEAVRAMEAGLNDLLGIGSAPDLSALPRLLDEAGAVLGAQLARRGLGSHEGTSEGEQGAASGMAGGSAGTPISGEIASRDDVVRVLDKVIAYYRRQEPTSPVPLLMVRAKRLVHMDFMEIIENLAPDAIAQIETIRGPEEPYQEEEAGE